MMNLLFRSEMVRGVLRGDKTETRRPTKRDGYGRVVRPKARRGDQVHVRETWSTLPSGRVVYRADGERELAWRPSIFMPRKASRITLELVSDPWIQLVGMIDAHAMRREGFPLPNDDPHLPGMGFFEYWERLHGELDLQLRVWVFEFRVLKVRKSAVYL